MKQLLQSLGLSTLKFLAALAVSSVVAYQGVEAWVESKIDDAMNEIKTIRQGDMALISEQYATLKKNDEMILKHLLEMKRGKK